MAMVLSGVLFLGALSAPTALAGPDSDFDGVDDSIDNCTLVPNGPFDLSFQVDSDGDGYGNPCDMDYNGDLLTTSLDFASFTTVIGFEVFGPDLQFDHDGDGAVTLNDFYLYMQYYTGTAGPAPGPSAP